LPGDFFLQPNAILFGESLILKTQYIIETKNEKSIEFKEFLHPHQVPQFTGCNEIVGVWFLEWFAIEHQ